MTDAAKPLYVRRDLLNGEDLVTWAKGVGFGPTLTPDDMHVTICYLKSPMAWAAVKRKRTWLAVPPTARGRKVEALGDKGAVVLRFESDELQKRHWVFRTAGASSDYEGYKPHVTITYSGEGVDLKGIGVYGGSLIFGPEIYDEPDNTWSDTVVEKAEGES